MLGTGETAENSTKHQSTRSSKFMGRDRQQTSKRVRDSTQGEAEGYGTKCSQSGGKGEGTGGFV